MEQVIPRSHTRLVVLDAVFVTGNANKCSTASQLSSDNSAPIGKSLKLKTHIAAVT